MMTCLDTNRILLEFFFLLFLLKLIQSGDVIQFIRMHKHKENWQLPSKLHICNLFAFENEVVLQIVYLFVSVCVCTCTCGRRSFAFKSIYVQYALMETAFNSLILTLTRAYWTCQHGKLHYNPLWIHFQPSQAKPRQYEHQQQLNAKMIVKNGL